MSSVWKIALVCLLAALLLAPSAQAYDLPAVNLGFTSFMDGAPPAGPGAYFTQYLQFYTTRSFTDLPPPPIFAEPDLNAIISLTQFIYQSDKAVIGTGKWGLDVIVPAVKFDLSHSGRGMGLGANSWGVGDILVGPYIQWDPIMGPNGPKLLQRVELQVILPTGKYSKTQNLNPGSNVVSINPYWSGTYFFQPNLTGSLRFHYLWNSENGDIDHQPGQAIHANLGVAYEAQPHKLRVGVNGYFLKQITDSKTNGQSDSTPKEQVIAIGPGGVYHFSQEDHLFVSLYFETAAKSRPEGTRATLRYVHHF